MSSFKSISSKEANKLIENCSELETVQLPYMITGIGECAFYKCGKLQHMVMQK